MAYHRKLKSGTSGFLQTSNSQDTYPNRSTGRLSGPSLCPVCVIQCFILVLNQSYLNAYAAPNSMLPGVRQRNG